MGKMMLGSAMGLMAGVGLMMTPMARSIRKEMRMSKRLMQRMMHKMMR